MEGWSGRDESAKECPQPKFTHSSCLLSRWGQPEPVSGRPGFSSYRSRPAEGSGAASALMVLSALWYPPGVAESRTAAVPQETLKGANEIH